MQYMIGINVLVSNVKHCVRGTEILLGYLCTRREALR
jgi:hypothetical protein